VPGAVTYGEPGALQRDDVLAWAAGGVDATFTRLHRAVVPHRGSLVSIFSTGSCMNLVPEPLGPTNAVKVTTAQLRAGAARLPKRLGALMPRVIWIASKQAALLAAPVIERLGMSYFVTAHPVDRRNVTDDELRAAWARAFGS
jgi:hypothetical protein